jgi:hypothetical protein
MEKLTVKMDQSGLFCSSRISLQAFLQALDSVLNVLYFKDIG